MKLLFKLIVVNLALVACSSSKNEELRYREIKQRGNEISNIAQATLLSNVGMALQKGGPEYAVQFCNLKANSIIDSLNRENDCNISRVSNKNRNPENILKTELELQLWETFSKGSLSDTLVQVRNHLVFYKPIKIAMPACLKCHGNPETEINSATMLKLDELYPNDLATGYSLNDFRGMWKIEFEID